MNYQRRSYLILAATMFSLAACAQAPKDAAPGDQVVLRSVDDVAAIRAAYQERLRLGLGSPFRLIEIVARDQRLSAETRAQLMHDLFEQTAAGEAYQAIHTLPLAHLRIVEHTIESARDPRIGELAVNLAYAIAAAEHTVGPELQYAAVSTAALLRDRALARDDAERVREQARAHRQSAHVMVPMMRAYRALSVEQPASTTMSPAAHDAAQGLADLILGGVRHAAREAPASAQPRWSGLDRDVAHNIMRLQQPDVRPPQSALLIAMRVSALPYSGRDEESFVAELALQPAHAQLAAQRAAVALRPYAQERIWHARSWAPSNADLLVRYGIAVNFDAAVPTAWRPYYRAQLDQAITDLQQVLPRLNLKGLTIEIGEVDGAAHHLAFHDPTRRVIRWSPSTGAGSLAHEIAHDLDWQLARRAYGKKARYASDYAVDVRAMMELTDVRAAGNERKTEIFARQFDWLVALTLAELGRTNGDLTSVQHDWLLGHGSALRPAASAVSAQALAGTIARSSALTADARTRIIKVITARRLVPSGPVLQKLSCDWLMSLTCGLPGDGSAMRSDRQMPFQVH